jgi:hypothetical protein
MESIKNGGTQQELTNAGENTTQDEARITIFVFVRFGYSQADS